MNNIQLQKKPDMDVTLVRNVFLDEYMPEASGEFVKIYLYLLRCASGEKEISMGRIADIFEHTEKDVTRALKYWDCSKKRSRGCIFCFRIAGRRLVPANFTF